MAVLGNGKDFGNALIAARGDMRKMAGSIRGQNLLSWFNSPFNNGFIDPFNRSTLDAFWTTATDAGATAFAQPAAANAIAGGGITGSTGASANEAVALHGKPNWSGDSNSGLLWTWSLDVITSMQPEIGFVDPLTDHTLPAVTDIDTPAIGNGAVTTALLALDTAETFATAALVLDGDATYATSKITPASAGYSAFTPVANTRYTTIIQLMGDYVRCVTFDNNFQTMFDLSSGLAFEGGTQVLPSFFVQTLNTTPKVATLNRFMVWGDKA